MGKIPEGTRPRGDFCHPYILEADPLLSSGGSKSISISISLHRVPVDSDTAPRPSGFTSSIPCCPVIEHFEFATDASTTFKQYGIHISFFTNPVYASRVQSKQGFRDDARKLFVEIPRFDLTRWKTL
ncbi:hypothetical protein WN943_004884 [Citrus x changshan-huyou]